MLDCTPLTKVCITTVCFIIDPNINTLTISMLDCTLTKVCITTVCFIIDPNINTLASVKDILHSEIDIYYHVL